MRLRLAKTKRRGATLAETAIVISVFLILVLGLLDLGIGVLRYNSVSHAARQGARQAMVHGALAPAGVQGGPWGPGTISAPATASGIPAVAALQPFLFTCDPPSTTIQVAWPDGNNQPGNRVSVTVTTPYQPMMTFIFGNPSITLQATSTVTIAH
jgi:Flp pilus assembly protein TadG